MSLRRANLRGRTTTMPARRGPRPQRTWTTLIVQQQSVGGYGCELVKPPPEHLQTECSICLHILRDAHLVDCCGNSFCQTCIDKVKRSRKTCPLCNIKFSTVVADKRLQRTLNGLDVYCSHKENGCEWVGSLGNFNEHLNTVPNTHDRLKGCGYVDINCIYCSKNFQRHDLQNHEVNECFQRPYTCIYCHTHKSTYDKVTNRHWKVCEHYPVNCPNNCGNHIERWYIEDHIHFKCTLQSVGCEFEFCGCPVKTLRKDMSKHLIDSSIEHTALLATSHKEQKAKFEFERQRTQEAIDQLQMENKTMKRIIDKQFTEIETLKHKLEAETLKHKLEVETSPVAIKKEHFVLSDFERRRKENEVWYSAPFYTHQQGYKMCLRVYVNGVGEGENNSVSVYVCLMSGEFDDYLEWPFRDIITIDLIDSKHTITSSEISFDEGHQTHQNCCCRIDSQKQSGRGLGFPCFITHTDLYEALPRLATKEADSLLFRITVKP